MDYAAITTILLVFSIMAVCFTLFGAIHLAFEGCWRHLLYLILPWGLIVAFWVYVGQGRTESVEIFKATVKTHAADVGKMQVVSWVEHGKFKTEHMRTFVNETDGFVMKKTSVSYGLGLFPSAQYKLAHESKEE